MLYYEDTNKPLTTKGVIPRSATEIYWAKKRLHALGFDIPRDKVMALQAVLINRMEEGLPSASDAAKADDIELQEITENAPRGMENLIAQLEGESLEDLHMCELLGPNKQLRSIRGSLKIELAEKVQLEECIEKEK